MATPKRCLWTFCCCQEHVETAVKQNLEMFMLIEHLASQIESIEKEIEASRYNKVNIDHLKEQVDGINKQIEKLRNGNH